MPKNVVYRAGKVIGVSDVKDTDEYITISFNQSCHLVADKLIQWDAEDEVYRAPFGLDEVERALLDWEAAKGFLKGVNKLIKWPE